MVSYQLLKQKGQMMKNLYKYLPTDFLKEDDYATNYTGFGIDTKSPISGNNTGWIRPDPTKTVDGKRVLEVGDPVRVINQKSFRFGECAHVQKNDNVHGMVTVRFKDNKSFGYSWKDLEYYDLSNKNDAHTAKEQSLHNLQIMAGIIKDE